MFGIDDALAGGILSGLGSFFGGNQQAAASKAGVEEQKREFNLGSMTGAARQAENAPMRDKLMAIFGQMLGQAPQQFRPRDAFNPVSGANLPTTTGTPLPGSGPGQYAAMSYAQPQYGGMNMANMATPAGYKMGDGGVNPDIYQYILAQLGYKPPSAQTPQAPGNPANPMNIPGYNPTGQNTTGPHNYYGPPSLNYPQAPRPR